jgi:hypothetical protein
MKGRNDNPQEIKIRPQIVAPFAVRNSADPKLVARAAINREGVPGTKIRVRFAPSVSYPVTVLAAPTSGRPARHPGNSRFSAPLRGSVLLGAQRPYARANVPTKGQQ